MKKYWKLGLIVLLGILLRFYHNLDISLWHDEAFSALMIRYPWREMFYRLGLDVHPPMYYIFLRFWHDLFGDSLLSLRGMSIFFGAASIWAAWAFVKEAFKNEQAALWAAVLVAINPFQLQYVTEARMYTMGAFFALLGAWFFVKALNAQKELHEDLSLHMPNLPGDLTLRKRMIGNYVGFTVSAAVMINTHYYLFFTAAALAGYGIIFLFCHHRWGYKKFIPLLLSLIGIFVSFLPWLKTFLFQLKQVGASYWIPPMDVWSIPSTFWDMLLGLSRDSSKISTQFWLAAITVFSFYLLYRFARKTESFHKYLVLMAVAAPFGGALLFALFAKLKGSSSSVYLDRYFLFGSMFFSVVVAVWLKEIRIKWLSVSLFFAYCALNLLTFNHYWSQLEVRTKPGMNAAAKYLQANVEPDQKIVVGSSFMFFNLKYYWTFKFRGCPSDPACTPQEFDQDTDYAFYNRVRPLLYTGGVVKASDISHFAGSALLSDNDLLPNLANAANPGDTVWVVWTNGFGASRLEAPKNWVSIDERIYPEVRPYVGANVYLTEYRVN